MFQRLSEQAGFLCELNSVWTLGSIENSNCALKVSSCLNHRRSRLNDSRVMKLKITGALDKETSQIGKLADE